MINNFHSANEEKALHMKKKKKNERKVEGKSKATYPSVLQVINHALIRVKPKVQAIDIR
jgi:hypothetical protein